MKYRFLKNHKETKVFKADSLFNKSTNKPKFASKAKFREWCADTATDHVFYSLCEGDNPNIRISNENPVNMIHGVVADYDAPLDWDVVDKLIQAQCKEYQPTWRTKTNSGYIRLIWEFEERMPISQELYEPFIKRLFTEMGVERLFAGFDSASYKASQYFEIGEDWVKIDAPLSKAVYRTCLIKAANDKPPGSSETSIPMEVLEKEVHEQFPNRWNGQFTVGARGPLFWIGDGIEREGCQVIEDGMICYSDRAGKGFLTWKEIFGSTFVKDYETKKMGSLLDQYWFNGKVHYTILHGAAEQIPKEQLELELRQMGFSPARKKGQPLSELEVAKLTIAKQNRINEVAPVVFSKERVVEYNSHRILNNANITPVEPADNGDIANWTFVHTWLNQLFAGKQTINYFYAWMKRFYEAVYERKFSQGQALILVGSTNKGKSLLSNRVISALVGGFADASDYLSGQTNFNKD